MSLATLSDRVRAVTLTAPLLAFLTAPRLRRAPDRLFGVLQRIDPVHRSPLGLTVLSRHGDVAATLRNATLASDEAKADLSQLRVLARLSQLVTGNSPDRDNPGPPGHR
jgi:hypothetical protein